MPFGLVRYGVAPDHPEVKNVINTFNSVLKHPNVTFVGNVEAGKDVAFKKLKDCYDAILMVSTECYLQLYIHSYVNDESSKTSNAWIFKLKCAHDSWSLDL